MPELPEVETVVRGLRALALERRIVAAKLRGAKLRAQNPRNFVAQVRGREIVDIRRRGKHFFVDLSDGLSLWCHLRMTGRFIEADRSYRFDNHDHAYLDLSTATRRSASEDTRLVWRDVRKFGYIRLLPTGALTEQREIAGLGPEPLEISAREFVSRLRSRRRAIKPALLDQSLIAGLGNIYVDEALHASGIHPLAVCAEVAEERLLQLRVVIRRLLRNAIKRMGTTFDSYTGVNGNPGEFQTYLKVYGREGEPCRGCGAPIVRRVIAQRSAHFCVECQK